MSKMPKFEFQPIETPSNNNKITPKQPTPLPTSKKKKKKLPPQNPASQSHTNVFKDGDSSIRITLLPGHGRHIKKGLFKGSEELFNFQVLYESSLDNRIKNMTVLYRSGKESLNLNPPKEGMNSYDVPIKSYLNNEVRFTLSFEYKIKAFRWKRVSFGISRRF